MPRPSPRQSARRPSARSGFTLIEMVIVVFLIAAAFVAFAPPRLYRSSLPGASETMVAKLRYTAERAVSTGRVHRLTIDLDAQRFRIEERPEPDLEDTSERDLAGSPALLDLKPPASPSDFEPIPTKEGEWEQFREDDVKIEAVRVGEVEVEEDTTFIGFAGEGGADPAEVRLVDDLGRAVAIQVVAFTGEVRSVEVEE